jgi:hypothetical protein
MLIQLLHEMKQLVEAVFTSYLLPALLVPLVWLLRRVTGGAIGGALSLGVLRIAYEAVALLLVLAWAGTRAGLPIELGGRTVTMAVWILFGALNFLFAAIAVRITGEYGRLPEGRPKDALFLRFLGTVLAQPVATLAAFSLLYRLLRLVYHREFPWLDAVQEGI